MVKKTHCKRGHEFTEQNTYQTYKNGRPDGRKCKQCQKETKRVDRKSEKNSSIKITRTNSHLKCRYGINSLEERDALLAAQGGACAVCGTTQCVWGKGFNTWHIDHKHDGTVNFRGILCGRCNTTLGQLERVPDLLRKFQGYLDSLS